MIVTAYWNYGCDCLKEILGIWWEIGYFNRSKTLIKDSLITFVLLSENQCWLWKSQWLIKKWRYKGILLHNRLTGIWDIKPSGVKYGNVHLCWTKRESESETEWRLSMVSSPVWVGILWIMCVHVCVENMEGDWEEWIIDELLLNAQAHKQTHLVASQPEKEKS